MTELITVENGPVRARLGARPVSMGEYRAYLHATGRAVPRPLTHGAGTDPAHYVSQVDAAEYLRWLGEREGARYRLPSTAELLALAEPHGPVGTSTDNIWPHSHGERPEMGPVYLCEWTCETETLDPFGPEEPRVLGSVFYPPWLRQGNNPKQVQGMMLASQGYSFVSFRVASDPASDLASHL